MTTLHLRKPTNRSRSRLAFILIPLLLGWFALLPKAQALLPPPVPDGGYLNFNTAEGQKALFSLTTGQWNTALGAYALWHNTDGSYNTAVGTAALLLNVGDQSTGAGTQNTAVGRAALLFNTTGSSNSAFGARTLVDNTAGSANTAIGNNALIINSTGSNNIAVGADAGNGITTGSNIIAIGAGVSGISSVAGQVDNSCYIGNILGAGVDPVTAVLVAVDADGKLGVQGFADGQSGNVSLQDVLKDHRKVQELETTAAQQAKGMEVLIAQLKEQAAQIQKVSAQLEARNPAPQMVLNNP